MSGHSKWSTIKHKKGKEDAKRGKIFTKISKELTVAARAGGGDPGGNSKLRLLMEKAKEANMPNENVTRAIKKGTGELEGAHYEEAMYEGYGPHGTAVIVETLSDNKNRTVSDVRHAFSKMGGNLGETNSVLWMFQHKAVLILEQKNKTEDDIIELFMDYDLDDIIIDTDHITLTTAPSGVEDLKKAAKEAGFIVEHAEVEWVAKDKVLLDDEEKEAKVFKFLELLEDLDDVQNVYSNIG
ncbi:YebC/PmpR family DNA-binding transcriptional regulator [Candidatus Babeliales bacterium]|nr:YebC/PmpR family DNA-binding transcriptional regulator [Candidatus Babeliales bacterium]